MRLSPCSQKTHTRDSVQHCIPYIPNQWGFAKNLIPARCTTSRHIMAVPRKTRCFRRRGRMQNHNTIPSLGPCPEILKTLRFRLMSPSSLLATGQVHSQPKAKLFGLMTSILESVPVLGPRLVGSRSSSRSNSSRLRSRPRAKT